MSIFFHIFFNYRQPILSEIFSPLISSVLLLIIGLILGVFVVWIPTYAYFGGWDNSSLEILEKAIKISGPSKGFVSFIWSFSSKISKISPFFGKYPIDTTGVNEEIQDLIEWRSEKMKSAS